MDTFIRITVLVTIAGAAAFIAAWPRLRAWYKAKNVHRRLSQANGLSGDEAAWLWRVARAACPDRPAQIVVRPSLLEVGPGAARADLAQAVHDKLFAS